MRGDSGLSSDYTQGGGTGPLEQDLATGPAGGGMEQAF